jgi:hypothetical protein
VTGRTYGQSVRRAAALGCAALLTFALTSCSRKSSDTLVPVAGVVTVNGAPLTTGSVTFHPDSASGNMTQHIPTGPIDPQGNYRLSTATKAGAPPGAYKVTVTAQAAIDPKNPYAPPTHLIDRKYADPVTSGLTMQVSPSPTAGAYDIKLAK